MKNAFEELNALFEEIENMDVREITKAFDDTFEKLGYQQGHYSSSREHKETLSVRFNGCNLKTYLYDNGRLECKLINEAA